MPASVTLPAGIVEGPDGMRRCWWPGSDPLYVGYHDKEWGRPVRDDIRLFEKLCLEGFQSGLSWLTILRKRENFRAAFAGFDFEKVAQFGARDVKRCLADAGIVRHRGKIESVINNAKRARELVDEEGSLAAFIWRYEPDPKSRPKRIERGGIVPTTRGVDGAFEGAPEARLVLRRADDGLRLHAGDGAGQRPSARLRLPRRGGGRAARLRAAKIAATDWSRPASPAFAAAATSCKADRCFGTEIASAAIE